MAPIAALACLGLLVVLPLLTMIIASLRPAGTLPFDDAPLILSNFSSVYMAPETATMLRNTIVYAVVPILVALPLAFSLAFLTERTDLPRRCSFPSASPFSPAP
jgi:ABC-type Fe3+ transport system permease subunit